MHATIFQCVWLFAAQASVSQLTPAVEVPLQPIPLQMENSPRFGDSELNRPQRRRIAPATPIEAIRNDEQDVDQGVTQHLALAPIRADERLMPVSHEQEIEHSATALLRQSLAPLDDESLTGRPLSLYSALERTSDRAQQLAVIKAYWELTAKLAEYQWAVKEAAFLATLPQPRDAVEQALLRVAREEAQAKEMETRLATVTAQYDLAEVARMTAREAPPLPLDLPLVSSYRTNFESIFANRTPPVGIRRIAKTLPLHHAALEARAAVAAGIAEVMQQLETSYSSGHTGLKDVLQTSERLGQHRQAFLMTVRDYNHSIAEYSLSVVSPGESRQTLVSTLIHLSPQTKSVLMQRRSDVRAAMNDPPYRQVPASDDAEQVAPQLRTRTFGDGAPNAAGSANWRNSGTNEGTAPASRFQPRSSFLQQPPRGTVVPQSFESDDNSFPQGNPSRFENVNP